MEPFRLGLVRLMAESSLPFLEAVFALYRRQQPFAVVRADVADDARLGDAPMSDIADGPKTGWFRAAYTPSDADTPAQVVFSSGTEGRPKAIVLTHRNLADVVRRLNAVMQVTPEIREYIGVPVTYSFGLGRARAVAAAGGEAYIPERFNPSEIRRMLERDEINALSAVPSLCRILLQSADMFEGIGDRVRWIEIGSQYMSRDEKLAMRRLFPKARIVQHYGLTEASRSSFLEISSTDPEKLESVGPVDGGIELRIGDDGAIAIRGDHVARHQMGDDGELLALTDADGWLVTKDRGEIRDGYLYFLGRLDDQINVSGVKLGAEHLEQHVLAQLPQLAGRFAITGVEDPMRGQMPLAALETGSRDVLPQLETALADAMTFYGVSGGEVFRTMLVDALPMTGTDKIQRARLRDLYNEALPASEPVPPKGKSATSVKEIYRHHFPQAELDQNTTFETLGGDSLNYLSVALDLERLLGEIPEGWERLSIAELDRITPTRPFLSRIDMATVMRALSITFIIAGHFSLLSNVSGGALVLFFIAGMSFGALTVPKVLQSGRVSAVFVLLLRIAVLTWAYITLNWLVTGYGSGLAYLFVTNWLEPGYPGGVWFVGVYIQIVLFLALLLSFSGVRKMLARDPFTASAGLSGVLIAVMALSEMMIDTHHLYRRLPHLLAWLFACGMAAHYADSLQRKLFVVALFLLGWLIFAGPGIGFVILAVPVIVLVPYIRLPQMMIPAIRMVAAASLLLYLSHFQFMRVTEILGIASPLVSTVAAIVGGTLAYMLYRPFDDLLRKWLVRLLG